MVMMNYSKQNKTKNENETLGTQFQQIIISRCKKLKKRYLS